MGSRYGVKIRKQMTKVRTATRLHHECPRCGKAKVKRISTSLFVCASCKTKFAGGAYVPRTGAGNASRAALAKQVDKKTE